MSKIIDKSEVIYSFNQDNKAVAAVKPDEIFTITTFDCFAGQLQSEDDSIAEMNWDHINPATGPVLIEGSEKGDILKVEIISIELDSPAVMIAAPKEGVLGHLIENPITKILPIEDNQVIFSDKYKFEIEPMVGVIGVAPDKNLDISTGTPGEHGGNMDCKLLGPGASVYFKVQTEGAMLAAGDMHALMGDGEIVVCAAEAGGKIKLKANIIKNKDLPVPFIEKDNLISTVASAKTLDEAVELATEKMANYLVENYDLEMTEAGMIMSLIGDAEICQVVDPLKTARFTIDKSKL
ncbi:MAG: acetamidase/formamidase family protein [Halarsenatibacteraceae bacterium]